MNASSPVDECELHCIWRGTDRCVRVVLTGRWLRQRHLSLGAHQGLKSLYPSSDPPPCVDFNGDIDWNHTPEERGQKPVDLEA